MGVVRELLGSGKLFGVDTFGASHKPTLLVTSPAGGIIILGIMLAAVRAVVKKRSAK